MAKRTLTPEQQQELILRDRWAQLGINYDKATRRFLAEHDMDADPNQRPTIKIRSLDLERLRVMM